MEENRKKIMDQISAFCVTICLRDERRALEPGFEFQREHENYLNALTGALGRFLVCALWLTETFLTPTRPVGAFSLLVASRGISGFRMTQTHESIGVILAGRCGLQDNRRRP
jgi:hypothetical protein